MSLLALHACVLLVALIVGIRVLLHTYGPISAACFHGWSTSGGVMLIVAGGGPRPLLWEITHVLPRHVRPGGELRNWAAPPGGVTKTHTKKPPILLFV